VNTGSYTCEFSAASACQCGAGQLFAALTAYISTKQPQSAHIGTLLNTLGKSHQMLLRFVELQLDAPARLHAIYFLPSCLPTGIACTVIGQVRLLYNLSFPAAVNISLWEIIYKAAHFASAKARRCPSLLGKSTASIKEE
jgi:hypothetical protein